MAWLEKWKVFKRVMHEMCLNTEFFWSLFSCIQIEDGDLRSKYVFNQNAGKQGPEENSGLEHFSRTKEN